MLKRLARGKYFHLFVRTLEMNKNDNFCNDVGDFIQNSDFNVLVNYD